MTKPRPAQPLPPERVRPIYVIAEDIVEHWANIYFGAVPYLQAMHHLTMITDKFHEDSASEVILYFLSNATRWRGEHARRIKQELNDLLVTR